jgi:FkbM family methyltransferase
MRRVLPPVSSVRHWLDFVLDCRAMSLADSARVFTNKGVFATRHFLHRMDPPERRPHTTWIDEPFNLKGVVAWSSVSKMWYVLEDEGTPGAMAKGREEPEEWMTGALSKGMTVIDVGAHQGRYSIEFSRRVGESGRVVAVEPSPRNLQLLTRNLSLNEIRNVHAVRAACWSRRMPLQLEESQTLDLGRVSASQKEDGSLIGFPLDDLVDDLGLRRVDQIKIDVEGAEIEVLAGSERTLRGLRPRVFVECHGIRSQVADWLVQRGYRVEREKEDPYHGAGFGWLLGVPG